MRELDASGSQWVAPDARSATVNQTVRCIRTRRTANRNRVSTTLPAGNLAPQIPPSSFVGVSGFDDQRADPSLIVLQGPQGPEAHCLLNIMKRDRSRLHAEVSCSRSQTCMVMLRANRGFQQTVTSFPCSALCRSPIHFNFRSIQCHPIQLTRR